ncbi:MULTISPECIES: fatty acid desaturase [unclassified Leptolyngbya]|uniref:fatty acid desaturase family protein n=1 Tax=unclassified Leptolyngbya TaxID=2650499 RepID=UPI001681DBC1|nr:MULTISPECIES: fatty acid desaturase [unclassified Leptolyngbya]MBD1913092.1 fatty acid desaturase [Leptolyngbya sp. FACHB-8]MBD2155562.1 fatty acid desaturase [Leptolyngbya sp. FACHB-16]
MKTSAAPSYALSQDLRAAVTDLEQVNPWVGLWRFVSIGTLFLSFVVLAWSSSTLVGFIGFSAIAGLLYAFWLVCTHDTTHQTLTGWRWFDTWMPRLVAYPMLWPYGTYARLHRLHHAWNGIDLRDPERVQWTVAEYRQAQPWQQWYVRHQWSMDLFVLGGLGLIAKTVYQGLRLRRQVPDLGRSLLLDGVGILAMQSGFAIVAILQGRFIDYLLFWLVLERIIGAVQQARDHLEHYALWKTEKNHQMTQLYACRNLTTSSFVNWLMGGLPDHAIHHAFPGIPFNHLPEAFRRTQAVLERHQRPLLVRDRGYLRETLHFSSQIQLI